jgi:hypothetical protein
MKVLRIQISKWIIRFQLKRVDPRIQICFGIVIYQIKGIKREIPL